MRLLDVRAKHLQFGFSTMRECLRGIEVFLHPSHHAEQMPWVRGARRRVSRGLRSTITGFRFFFEPTVETFGFPWIDWSEYTLEAELQSLRSHESRYIDAVVKRLSGARLFTPDDMKRIRRPGWYRKAADEYMRLHPQASAALSGFLESPTHSLNSFCDMITTFYDQAIASGWDSIRQRLLDDIMMRQHLLRENGVAALLRTLSSGLSIQNGREGLALEYPGGSGELKLGESGVLLLTPSFFAWPHTQTLFLKSGGFPRCVMTYPLPPLSTRAQRLDNTGDLVRAFEALSDPLRFRIVELLRERDLSTRELSGFLTVSEPVVSRHLRRLLQCGLVTQQRRGYFVMYGLCRTAIKKLSQGLSALT